MFHAHLSHAHFIPFSVPHVLSQRSRNCRSGVLRKLTTTLAAAKTCTLPNGKSVRYVSKPDVTFLYHEIYEKQAYLQHGITLQPGHVVLDVGANIGLFADIAAQKVGDAGKVIACEPILPVFQAAQANVQALRGASWADVKLLNVGVGDGSHDSAEFTVYPAAAGWSTMRPDSEEVADAMAVYLDASLGSLQGHDGGLLARAGSLIRRAAPRWLYEAATRAFVRRMLARSVRCTCRLVTVSDIIAQEGLRAVDLLKVDVERAELDVLHGVAERDWPRIRQLVMEVHNVDGNLAKAQALLRERAGFQQCVVDQDAQLAGSTIYNIYCRRR